MIPPPCGSSRSRMACAIARPIHSDPNERERHGRGQRTPARSGIARPSRNTTGKNATRPAGPGARRRSARPRQARSAPRNAGEPDRPAGSYIGTARAGRRSRAARAPAAKTRPPAATMTIAKTAAGTRPRAARRGPSAGGGGVARARGRPRRARAISGRRSAACAPRTRPARPRSPRARSPATAVGEHQLAVGGLPQQVVREALLAARADDQVRVVHLRRVEVRAELLLRRAGESRARRRRSPPGRRS